MKATPVLCAVDTREQLPYEFPEHFVCIRKALPSGDYSVLGHELVFSIERKSLTDLLGCIFTERFKAELRRLSSYRHAFLAIESSIYRIEHNKYYKGNPKSVIGFLESVPLLYGVQVLFLDDRATAQRYVAGLIEKYNKYSLNEKREEFAKQ